MGSQIQKSNNVYVDMQQIEFVDSTISLGTSSGEYNITSTPQMSNVQDHTAALNLKRSASDG